MVEVKVQSGVETYDTTKQDASIVALQDIVSLEYAEAITYDEAWELGESLLEFFEAFSEEGAGNDDTATRASS